MGIHGGAVGFHHFVEGLPRYKTDGIPTHRKGLQRIQIVLALTAQLEGFYLLNQSVFLLQVLLLTFNLAGHFGLARVEEGVLCFAESPPEFLFVTGGAGSDGFPLFLEVHHFRSVFAPVGACGQGFSPFDEGEFLTLEGIADLFLRVVEQLLFAKEDIGQLAELCPQRLVVLLASEAGFLPFFLQIQNGRSGLLPGRMGGLNLFRHHFAKLLDQGCFRFRIGFEAFADLVIVRFGFLKNRADDAKECV